MSDVPDIVPDTVPDGPLVDLKAVERVLRRVEAHQDVIGWHNQPFMNVYVVIEAADAVTLATFERSMGGSGEQAIRTGRYTAQPLIPRQVFEYGWREHRTQAHDALSQYAFNIAFLDPDDMPEPLPDVPLGGDPGAMLRAWRQVLAMPGVMGFMTCAEVYGFSGVTRDFRDQVLQRARAGVRMDEQGGREARMATMVDADDRIHRLTRVRGEPTELDLDAPVRGQVVNALRTLMDTAAGRLPTDQAGYDARYPTVRGQSGGVTVT